MNPCKITEDLLPLYVEDACSDDSREYVEQHMASCPACQTLHSQMTRVLKSSVTHADAKKSFRLFRRRMLRKRILLVSVCSLLMLTLLTACLYRPVDRWLNTELTASIEPVSAEMSRLPDGSICVRLEYTQDSPYLDRFAVTVSPEEPGVLRISPLYTRTGQINQVWNSILYDGQFNNAVQYHAFYPASFGYRITQPFAALGNTNELWSGVFGPVAKIVLTGSDGETVLWQEGDQLPEADEAAVYAWENILKNHPYQNAPAPTTPPFLLPGTTALPGVFRLPQTTALPDASRLPMTTALPDVSLLNDPAGQAEPAPTLQPAE